MSTVSLETVITDKAIGFIGSKWLEAEVATARDVYVEAAMEISHRSLLNRFNCLVMSEVQTVLFDLVYTCTI